MSTRALDQSKKVRQEFFERLARDNVDFTKFSDGDRLSLVKNGLTDFEPSVRIACCTYLANQLCDASGEQSGLNAFSKLSLSSNWENVKASEAVRLVYTEVIAPTWGQKVLTEIESFNKEILSFASFDSRTQLLKLFEGLLLVSLKFTEDSESTVDIKALPSL